jgi:hypothetical protein
MSFHNRARINFYVTRPQFPEERNVFRLADGRTKVQSVVIRKVLEGETDYLPVEIHERLKIALAHDNVTIEGYRYLSGVGVVAEADYEIAWVTGLLDYPLAKAAFKVEVTPYDVTNDNCQSCAEATQLALEDDTITGLYDSLEEGSTTEYNVFENDSICCKPITAEIVTINSLFVDSATIDSASGIVEIILHATTPSGTNVNLLTYRVTCPNGSYDDADVFANISGSEETCLAPGSLDPGTISATGATPNWFDLPSPNPESYNYNLYLSSDLFNPIDSGNTNQTSVNYTNLESGTCYTFFVQSVCEGGGTSEFISIEFCTAEAEVSCGRYEACFDDGSGERGPFTTLTYTNCVGDEVDQIVFNMSCRIVCMLENSASEPFSATGVTTITYIEPC